MLFWIIGPIVLFRSVYNILVFILKKKTLAGSPSGENVVWFMRKP